MPAQEKLSRNEQLLAYLAGIGIVIIVVALFLMALGSADGDLTSSLLIVGVVVLLLAIAAWLYLLKPWRRFDDLKTPYFTGHEGHAAPATLADDAALADAEAMVAAAAPRGAEVVGVAAEVEAPVAEDFVEAAPPGERLAEVEPDLPAPLGETAVIVEEEPELPALFGEVAVIIEEEPELPAPLGETAVLVEEEEPELPAPLGEVAVIIEEEEPELPAPLGETALIVEEEPAPASPAEQAPAVAPPDPDAARDDLTLIDGIGARSQTALYGAGITTYAQVAALTPDALERTVREANVRLVASTATWPMQADLAARGDWAGLEALMTRIRGGVLHDELTVIAGVGPQAQQALWAAGYRTLADVAAASSADLRAALLRSSVPDTPTDTWPEQARGLLRGAAE